MSTQINAVIKHQFTKRNVLYVLSFEHEARFLQTETPIGFYQYRTDVNHEIKQKIMPIKLQFLT